MQLVQSSNPCGVVKINFSTVLSTVKSATKQKLSNESKISKLNKK